MNLDLQLMDVLTTYLYGSLNAHIYMKIPNGFKIPEIRENENRNMYSGTVISWRYIKQAMVTTSSNHSEIISLYEASRECVWLQQLVRHIYGSCGIATNDISPTVLYKDNAALVTQMINGYVKGHLTKHIAQKLFYPYKLQKNGTIIVEKVCSNDNLIDLFTKSLPTSTFEKYVHGIEIRRLGRLLSSRGATISKLS